MASKTILCSKCEFSKSIENLKKNTLFNVRKLQIQAKMAPNEPRWLQNDSKTALGPLLGCSWLLLAALRLLLAALGLLLGCSWLLWGCPWPHMHVRAHTHMPKDSHAYARARTHTHTHTHKDEKRPQHGPVIPNPRAT